MFQTLGEAREASNEQRRRDTDAAIIAANEAMGGDGLHDVGRGDPDGAIVQQRDAAIAAAEQRHNDRVAAAWKRFNAGPPPFGYAGFADSPEAARWLQTGEA